MMEQFPTVPYLNSSLFEMSQLEEEFFPISGIRMGEMDVLRNGSERRSWQEDFRQEADAQLFI